MSPIVDLVIAAGALWRLTSLLLEEEGPFQVFERFRHRLGVFEGEPIPATWAGGLFSCYYCMTLALGIPWGILWGLALWTTPGGEVFMHKHFADVLRLVALPFALSAVAIVWENYAQ